MPRPIRIEYENAFYHVMNRGRARNNIFFTEIHYLTFLKILGESCERFGCVIHGYCLMPNHYHLLIQTPNANLGRIMRHVNGVYTQKFNNLQKADMFELKHSGSVIRSLSKMKEIIKDNFLEKKLGEIEGGLWFMERT